MHNDFTFQTLCPPFLWPSVTAGEWEMLDEGVGYNQYDPFLPHARYKHAGVPLSNTTFVFFGGCARYRVSYTLQWVSCDWQLPADVLPHVVHSNIHIVMPLSSRINVFQWKDMSQNFSLHAFICPELLLGQFVGNLISQILRFCVLMFRSLCPPQFSQLPLYFTQQSLPVKHNTDRV